jgi:hypothetical protein
MNKAIATIAAVVGFAVLSANANAQSSQTSTNSAALTTNSTSNNQGNNLTNNFMSPSDTDSHIHYSGATGANTAVGLGSFSSSFSSDYCGGVAQGGVSAPYVTMAFGKPTLGEPGEACVKTRTAIHTFEMAVSYGQAATLASSKGDKDSAAAYHTMSDKLSTAAVSILCNVDADVKQAYEAAGIVCSKTAKEEAADKQASAEQVQKQAVAQGQPTDPFVRARMGLPALDSTQVASK